MQELSEQGRPARSGGAGGAAGGLPGAWLAIVIAAASGGLFGAWAWTRAETPAPTGAGSRLAEIGQDEIPAALDTVAVPPEQLAQFRKRDACKRRLASVTVVRSPGQPPGHIRLQSGGYISPAFELGEAPVRVALPFPAPYPAGHGTLSVLGTTVDAVVALTPPWHVAAQGGPHTLEVTWAPTACPGASG